MKLTDKFMFAAISGTILLAGFGQLAHANGGLADADASAEVLASAPYRDGQGSIEVRRIVEDGADAVMVVRTAAIGTRYSMPTEWTELPLADQMVRVYAELTGERLTDEAYLALLDVEAQKAENDFLDTLSAATGQTADAPRSACPVTFPSPYFFQYECHVYGPVSNAVAGVDDVCLLTSAIAGNHSMQISYKAANGNFYDNYHATVNQGHYVAAQVLTGVKRVRKGHIYNAAASDYSYYAFDGDFKLEGFYNPNLTQCQTLAE